VSIDRLHSYPKVWNLGHPAIANLFDGAVVVQEKVDGSQFTFGLVGGVLRLRSKGAEIHGVEGADKLFRGAAETAQRLADAGKLVDGWQYRGEAMHAPKHNSLTYGRAPLGNVILFDVDTGLENRVAEPGMLAAIAAELGMECVPTFHHGPVENLEELRAFLACESCLGGCKPEGVVIKNYARWGEDGKMLMGKLVSEDFRETHKREWVRSNPGREDILERLKDAYRTERRWEKAIERLRDAGTLENGPRDIGPLLKAIPEDVLEECRQEIADALFAAFWPDIKRGTTAGFPEWYKARLVAAQPFAPEPTP
jgi:hypothetical protein